MKLLLRLVLVAAIALPVCALIALWMCFQSVPIVARKAEISQADIERAKEIVAQHDPAKTKGATLRTMTLSQDEVDVVLNYTASQLRRGSAQVVLKPGVATVRASLEVRESPFGRWLNVNASLRETDRLPRFQHVKIGSLPVPGFIADRALTRLTARLNATAQGRLAADILRSVTITENQVHIVYEWRDDTPDKVRTVLLPPEDEERIKVYSEHLVDILASGGSLSISLADLLVPMFALARQRSAGGDAAKENRGAIIALAFYVNGRGLSAAIPAARTWRRPVQRPVTLDGRDDFPKHFLISAAIAGEAGGPLADAVGLNKEVEDSRGGSGFSFADIAADRAGTRFGELAVKAPQKVQAALAPGVSERDFMPNVSDLPEFMPEAEFKKRYGGIGAPGYQKMMADIDARIASTTLFR